VAGRGLAGRGLAGRGLAGRAVLSTGGVRRVTGRGVTSAG